MAECPVLLLPSVCLHMRVILVIENCDRALFCDGNWVQMQETAAARVNADAYLCVRESQFRSRCGNAHAALKSSELMATLLFDKLSSYAAALMEVSHQEDDSKGVFFFNEHYVVKPPQTAVEFRWHRDDDEQLGMCVHRASIPPYLSAWCALDDINLQNGPLRFVSQSLAPSQEQAAASSDACEATESAGMELESIATNPILAPAGTVIFFLSSVWHCSSCNESDTMRRAFYAQYSTRRITATPKDSWPLSFAIPCHRASATRINQATQRVIVDKLDAPRNSE